MVFVDVLVETFESIKTGNTRGTLLSDFLGQ